MAARIARSAGSSLKSARRGRLFDTNSLFVYGLNWRTGSGELRQYFEKYGKIDGTHIIMNHYMGMSKGMGLIKFHNYESVSAAVADRNHYLDGNPIDIKISDNSSNEKDIVRDDTNSNDNISDSATEEH